MDEAARFQRVSELFESLRDLPPDQVAQALDLVEPSEIRAEIAAMLAADRSGTPTVRTIVDVAGVIDEVHAPPAVPSRIAQYEVLGVIGYGATGVVLRGRHLDGGPVVAIKVLASGAWNPSALARFRREVRLLERLSHPGIARMIEAGTDTSGVAMQPFFVMEYIEGDTLSAWLRAEPRDLAAILRVFIDIVDAVGYAHAAGVVHRDLKPGNILVSSAGRAKVLDFGVASISGDDAASDHLRTLTRQLGLGRRTIGAGTRSGALFGTLPYMSPEQFGPSRKIDWRSDLYAIGVMLFEALAGRLPYRSSVQTLAEASAAIRDEQPLTLGSIERSMRGEIEAVVARLLEKNPERRYQSALELREELERLREGRPTVARPLGKFERAGRFAARYPWIVAAAAVLVVSLGGALGYTVHRWQRAMAQQADLARSLEARARADYDRVIGEAASSLRAGSLEAARATLSLASPERRGFEWNLLARRAAEESRTLVTYGLPKTLRAAGGRLVYRAAEESFHALDALDGSPRTLAKASQRHLGLALSPDGARAATVDAVDGVVMLWRIDVAGPARLLAALDMADHGLRSPAAQVEWSPMGDEIAVVCVDGSCAVLGAERGELRRKAPALPVARTSFEAPHAFVRFMGSSGRLVVGARGGTRVAFIETNGAVAEVELGPRQAESLAATSIGAGTVLVGCDDGRIVVLGADAAAAARIIDAHNGPVYALAVDAEGSVVASSGGDSTVRLWEVAGGRAVGAVRAIEGGARALEIAALGSGAADASVQLVAAAPDGSLRFFPLAAVALETDIVVGGADAPLAAFLSDGTLVTARSVGAEALLKTETTRRQRVGSWPTDASLSAATIRALLAPVEPEAARAGSDLAVVAVSLDDAGRTFVANRTEEGAWRTRDAGIAGDLVAARLHDGGICVASRTEGKLMLLAPTDDAPRSVALPTNLGVSAVAAQAPHALLVAQGRDILLVDPASAEPRVLRIHTAEAAVVALATAARGQACIAQLETGALVSLALRDDRQAAVRWQVSPSPSGESTALAVDPDGTRVVVARASGEVLLLDAADGRTMLELEPVGARVASMSFSPTGAALAIARADGLVRILDASPMTVTEDATTRSVP